MRRYAAFRRQFGAHLPNESSLLDYKATNIESCLISQTHSWVFCISRDKQILASQLFGGVKPSQYSFTKMHAIMSILKPLITWWPMVYCRSIGRLWVATDYLGRPLSQTCAGLRVTMAWQGDNDARLRQTAEFTPNVMLKMMSDWEVCYQSFEYLIMDDRENGLTIAGEEMWEKRHTY